MKLPLTYIMASIQPLNLGQAILIVSLGRLEKEAWMRPISSSLVLQAILLASLFTVLHTKKPIGLRSGEFGGQISGVVKSQKRLANHHWLFLKVWQGAESYYQANGLYPSVSLVQGSTTASRTSKYATVLTCWGRCPPSPVPAWRSSSPWWCQTGGSSPSSQQRPGNHSKSWSDPTNSPHKWPRHLQQLWDLVAVMTSAEISINTACLFQTWGYVKAYIPLKVCCNTTREANWLTVFCFRSITNVVFEILNFEVGQ